MRALAAVAALLLALPAYAAGPWTNVRSQSGAPCKGVGSGDAVVEAGASCYYPFDQSDGTFTTGLIRLAALTGRVILDPDTGGAAGAARAVVYTCPGASADLDACVEVSGTLDGTGGPAATQTASVSVGTGWFVIDVTTGAGAGETGRIYLAGDIP